MTRKPLYQVADFCAGLLEPPPTLPACPLCSRDYDPRQGCAACGWLEGGLAHPSRAEALSEPLEPDRTVSRVIPPTLGRSGFLGRVWTPPRRTEAIILGFEALFAVGLVLRSVYELGRRGWKAVSGGF